MISITLLEVFKHNYVGLLSGKRPRPKILNVNNNRLNTLESKYNPKPIETKLISTTKKMV